MGAKKCGFSKIFEARQRHRTTILQAGSQFLSNKPRPPAFFMLKKNPTMMKHFATVFLLATLTVGACTYTQKVKDGNFAFERKQYAVATDLLERPLPKNNARRNANSVVLPLRAHGIATVKVKFRSQGSGGNLSPHHQYPGIV